MSLVGTRPPTVDEWEQYELHHRSRMSTKPGITGMWQVSGRSDITDFEEVVRLDTEYIEMRYLWTVLLVWLIVSWCGNRRIKGNAGILMIILNFLKFSHSKVNPQTVLSIIG